MKKLDLEIQNKDILALLRSLSRKTRGPVISRALKHYLGTPEGQEVFKVFTKSSAKGCGLDINVKDPIAKWIEDNKHRIIKHSKDYFGVQYFEKDDYLQQAYITALEATKVAIEKGISFESCFFTLFKRHLSEYRTDPFYKTGMM